MLIQLNDYNFKFKNITFDEEENIIYYTKNKYIKANIIDLKKFIIQSLKLSLSFDKEIEYWDFISENFDYMDMSFNPLNRKMIAIKLANLIIKNNWIRKNSFIKNKLIIHKTKDKLFNYLFILSNCISNITSLQERIEDNTYFSIYDFIFNNE